MPEKCTCGTTLVDDARFCHRCGRPTSQAPENVASDETPARQNEPEFSGAPAEGLQTTLAQAPIGFGNPIALRVAFIMALTIMLLELIPGLNFLFVFWWVAAGWGAVMLYRRITGFSLGVPAGARLGALTGVLTFIGMTLISALTMVVAGKQVLDTMVKQNPEMQQVVNDPPTLVAVFLVVLVMIFCLVVGVCSAGGALAAKSINKRPSE